MVNIYLLTFPRSGSVFFMKSTQIPQIEQTHSVSDIKTQEYGVIGIVRDPIESLTSYVAMLDYFNKPIIPEYNSVFEEKQRWIDHYKEVYSYYVNSKCFLILNEDLRNYPEKTVNGILEKFNLFNSFNKTNSKNLPDGQYIPTSKNTKNYAKIMKMFKEENLEELYTLYNMAKEKAIRF
jgi:hypothetical protein